MQKTYVNDLDVWNEAGNLDLKRFNMWLAKCPDDGVELIFEKDTYRFDTTSAPGIFFDVSGVNNVVFNGMDSEFIFGEIGNYFKIDRCSNVTLKNIKLDWDWSVYPLASVGMVKKVSTDGSYVEMDFLQWEKVDEKMPIQMVGPLDPDTFAPGIPYGVEFRPFVNPHIPDFIRKSDAKELKAMVRELEDRFESLEAVGSSIIRFRMKSPEWTKDWIKEGQAYHFRHYEYDTVGILVEHSEGIYFDHVTMYSCPGSGYVVRNDVSGFGFDHCKIILKPGTNRTITTTADGLHIANTQGDFYVKNCTFSRSGDDCINFHDNTLMGFKILDERRIYFENYQYDRLPIHIGDLLEFRNADLSPSGIQLEVAGIVIDENNNSAVLMFDEHKTHELSEDMIVWNRRYHTGNFVISNNQFYENRARAILVHGSDGIIENNHFRWIQGSAIQIETGAEVRWAEGTGVENVVIRNNHFQSCDVNGWNMATIYMGVYLPGGRTSYPIFRNISIMDNTFIDGPRQAVFISSAIKVEVIGNSITNYLQRDLDESSYGSSQIEGPVYDESYENLIQSVKSKQVEISHLF